MYFILPDYFSSKMDDLRTIFKVRAGESRVQQLLAEERVSRAKKMMTPFVLRRRKDHVRNRLFITRRMLTVTSGPERPSKEIRAH
jgi:SWI/SNF-related matrix-associated actin-dependent regulator 1 of chromatin subfamily A